MNQDPQYLIRKVERCPECEGVGANLNHFWAETFKHFKGPEFSNEKALEFMRERFGVSELPPEEDACPECEGSGKLDREVPLTAEILLEIAGDAFTDDAFARRVLLALRGSAQI